MTSTFRRLTVFAAALAITAAACSSATGSSTSTTRPTFQFIPAEYALTAFDACDDFLSYVKDHALDLVGPWGLEGMGWGWWGGGFFVADAAGERRLGGDDFSGPPVAGVDYSTTNVQEAGVDEADIWKTDGTRIVAVANGSLHLIDVSSGTPELVDSVPIDDGWAQELFLVGDKVLVMGTVSHTYIGPLPVDARIAPSFETPISTITEFHITNSGLDEVHRLKIDGAYISARMVDGTIRVVMSSFPTGLAFTFPEGGGIQAEQEAEEHNRQVVLDSTIENWVPYYVLEDADGDTITEGALLPCERAHYPTEFSGLQMLSVVTIDSSENLAVADAVGVLAGGQTVYASADSLYVAIQKWVDWSAAEGDAPVVVDGFRSQIHKFDISHPAITRYVASGEVDGFLLNQFAMSEHDGYLRVASTTRPAWWGEGTDVALSQSMVTVLADNGGELRQVGQVDGLGRGEQIFAVRMFGDTGYVVTFRQVDPLYVIDLSDPTNPTVEGELKITGYSAYLHPLGDGLLLGVGQDATEEGRVTGTQVSVFDVSDPTNPRRIHQYALTDTYSEAEWDHRAFLRWGDLVVVPIQKWSFDEASGREDFFSGALVLRVTADGIEEIGKVSHSDAAKELDVTGTDFYPWTPPIRRSLVAGDVLYTMSDFGIQGNRLADLEETGFADLGWGAWIQEGEVIDEVIVEEIDPEMVEELIARWLDNNDTELTLEQITEMLAELGIELDSELSPEDFATVLDDLLQDTTGS